MSPTSNHDQNISVTVESIRDFNVKMIDMAQANAEAVFDFARQLATAKQPSDMVELWTAHAKKQFKTLTEQTKELSALGQKIASEAASRSRAASTRHSRKPPDRRFLETLHRLQHCGSSIMSAPIKMHVKKNFAVDQTTSGKRPLYACGWPMALR